MADIAFSVFFKTDCTVAMVYSSASARLDFVAEWAKNRAANTSPTPVKTTLLSPMIGIDIVYRSFEWPVNGKGINHEKILYFILLAIHNSITVTVAKKPNQFSVRCKIS